MFSWMFNRLNIPWLYQEHFSDTINIKIAIYWHCYCEMNCDICSIIEFLFLLWSFFALSNWLTVSLLQEFPKALVKVLGKGTCSLIRSSEADLEHWLKATGPSNLLQLWLLSNLDKQLPLWFLLKVNQDLLVSWWLIYLYQLSLHWRSFTVNFSLKQKWSICMLHKFLNVCYITYTGKSEIINQFLLLWVMDQWNKTQKIISFISLISFFHMIKWKLILLFLYTTSIPIMWITEIWQFLIILLCILSLFWCWYS